MDKESYRVKKTKTCSNCDFGYVVRVGPGVLPKAYCNRLIPKGGAIEEWWDLVCEYTVSAEGYCKKYQKTAK